MVQIAQKYAAHKAGRGGRRGPRALGRGELPGVFRAFLFMTKNATRALAFWKDARYNNQLIAYSAAQKALREHRAPYAA